MCSVFWMCDSQALVNGKCRLLSLLVARVEDDLAFGIASCLRCGDM